MKPTRFELVALLTAAGIIAYQLFVPPLIGLADSGDFGRVIAWKGLGHVSTEYNDMYFRYFNSQYRFLTKLPGPEEYKTSTSFLVIPAMKLSILAGQDRIFDIRILATLYVLLYLFGIWLILLATRSLGSKVRVVFSALLILIFTDVGYVAYFNSFYSEGTALAFLSIALGCALILIAEESSSTLYLIGYFLAVGMAVTSKPMYVPLTPAFALFGIYITKYVRFFKRYWIVSGVAVLLCCVSFWYLRQVPAMWSLQSIYVELFTDMLPHSNDPRQDLAELGLDPDYAAFSGTTPFQPDSPLRVDPKFQDDLRTKVTSYTFPLFYLTRPGRLYGLSVRCVKHAFTTRVDRLGYYEASAGKPPFAKPFGIWSVVREKTFPRSVPFFGLFFATAFGVLLLLIRKSSAKLRGIYFVYLLFVFIALAQFFIAIAAGGGEPDVGKHLFMFNLAFDACFFLLILGAIHSASILTLYLRFGHIRHNPGYNSQDHTSQKQTPEA